MENANYSKELAEIEVLFNDEAIDEEIGYREDQEYYED